jgi:hypothetical protein
VVGSAVEVVVALAAGAAVPQLEGWSIARRACSITWMISLSSSAGVVALADRVDVRDQPAGHCRCAVIADQRDGALLGDNPHPGAEYQWVSKVCPCFGAVTAATRDRYPGCGLTCMDAVEP